MDKIKLPQAVGLGIFSCKRLCRCCTYWIGCITMTLLSYVSMEEATDFREQRLEAMKMNSRQDYSSHFILRRSI